LARTDTAARRAIRLDSASAAAYTALGDMYRQQGRVEEAEKSFRKAIELNPGYDTAHHWLADLLMQSLKGEEALREIDIAESLDPVAPAIVAEKAQALMMLGRYPDAEEWLDHATELLPDSPLLRAWATWFYAILGRWDRAAEHFGRVFELEGQDPDAIARASAGLRDPTRREAFLRLIADGRFAETGLRNGAGAEGMGGVHFRFVATRILDGDDRAMDLLEEMASGPKVSTIYVPVLPALMGPELTATPRARRLMERLALRDVGGG
ncbi:MAG TPA: tetratricopeptide repeat protein, partial [Longimicrobiales bacterium]|nr:tetratricopeptide repeat protein [Longimicrobiales bacterium]